ncbi:MAG: DUF4150 domain-containing protein [Helicobacteraceae bacterium]|nr:DUF4150 domain-containing protein [Helicobacteraceae bacterium]
MFQVTMMDATNMAMPDVCKTPTPVGPVPIPYPNISMSSTAVGMVPTMLVDGTPVLNMMSEIVTSQGDEAGVAGGIISSMIMGPTSYTLGSETLFIEGMPSVKLTSVTGQNGEIMNAIGACTVPSQTIMLVLS